MTVFKWLDYYSLKLFSIIKNINYVKGAMKTDNYFIYIIDQYIFEKTEEFQSDSIRIQKVTLPIGPVLVLGSSNFPLAYSTAGGDTIAAFAAGCCVLVKAHAMHAGTSVLVAECIEDARKTLNLPEGVFTHVLDDGFQHAQRLCLDERIQAIGFTGSFSGHEQTNK